ncbi:hypothetical protein TNCV_1916321 [Trichonephila clavipes]|uniref:Uncharacterized protein n=1 Tax=Trichonephila clavipes TaxID=2585209 RepID=A0A8X6W096_TRICX|nr:hypothetical protein TNCV_1916321 [Trichonephila clavipes]
MFNACVVGGTQNIRRIASLFEKWMKRKKDQWPLTSLPTMFALKIGVDPSYIVLPPVWCSKRWITADVKLAPCLNEFHGIRADIVNQVALETL